MIWRCTSGRGLKGWVVILATALLAIGLAWLLRPSAEGGFRAWVDREVASPDGRYIASVVFLPDDSSTWVLVILHPRSVRLALDSDGYVQRGQITRMRKNTVVCGREAPQGQTSIRWVGSRMLEVDAPVMWDPYLRWQSTWRDVTVVATRRR